MPAKAKPVWLDSWSDPLANIKTWSQNVVTGNFRRTGDHELVVADDAKQLKIFADTSRINTVRLLDYPTAVAAFYHPSCPTYPFLAVGCGPPTPRRSA